MKKKITAMGMALLFGVTVLNGCKTMQAEEVPQLLEPVEITLIGKKAVRGDIQDIEGFKGSIKAESVSYAFSQSCHVEDMTVHVGEYVNQGDLIARVDTGEYEKEAADLRAELDYLIKMNEIETQLSDIPVQNTQIDLIQMGPGAGEWYEETEKTLESLVEERDFEKNERSFEIENKRAELKALEEGNGSRDIYAKESGYLTYVKDFSVDNPTGFINANEIVAITAKEDSYYIASTMPLVTAREADFVYAEIQGKRYDLTYEPYDESEMKRAAKADITPESRFSCKEDLSAFKGCEVTVYAVKNYREDVISISPDAFFSENNTDFVYLIQDGKKIKHEVVGGVHTKNEVEIISGLSEGDIVYSQSGDIPGSSYSLVTVERKKLDITKRYDTAKLTYPLVSQVVNDAEGATVKEICVKNGQEVKKGDTIVVLEAGLGNGVVLEDRTNLQSLKRNYDYEMAQYQTKLDEKQKRANQMTENKTTATVEYKKLSLEIREIQLNMEKETVSYQYETERLNRSYAKKIKENGEIRITAARDGIVRELASLSEGYAIAADTLICKITDPSFPCIKLFTDGVTVPIGSSVTIVKNGNSEELRGTVAGCFSDCRRSIYSDGMYLNEKSAQSNDATYIVLEDESAYEGLSSFGVKINVWNVEDAIVVDSRCVYLQGDKKTGKRFVWVNENGNFSKRYVTVGYLDSDVAWIVQGLDEGEQILCENRKGEE